MTDLKDAPGRTGFCNVCGKRLVTVPLGLVSKSGTLYDEETGDLKYTRVCPTFQCEHHGLSHEWESEYRNTWFSRFYKSRPITGYIVCSRCGERR